MVPTGEYWSAWGLVVILVAIQIGGLGVMTLASLLGMAVSRRIGLTQRLLVSSETKETRLGEVGSLIRTVIITSVALELTIALVLFPRFLMFDEDLGEAAWHSIFYAISVVQQRRLRADAVRARAVRVRLVGADAHHHRRVHRLARLPRDPQRGPAPARAAAVEPALQARR